MPFRATPTASTVTVLVTVALVCVAVSVVGLQRDPSRAAVGAASASDTPVVSAPTRSEVSAAALLRAWDVGRAQAWGSGDVAALRSLYVPGSLAGRRDAAMLRRWTDRGLVVRDLRTQLLEVRQRRRAPGLLVLEVTDRLAGGVVAGPGTRRALPRDAATERTVVLRRVGAGWRVAAVREVSRPR